MLYFAGPAPADLDNWFLDVQLAYGEFRADQIAINMETEINRIRFEFEEEEEHMEKERKKKLVTEDMEDAEDKLKKLKEKVVND